MEKSKPQYKVKINKRGTKQIEKASPAVRLLFNDLVNDIKEKGPIRSEWKNFSDLGKNKYHCHLNYSYVVCWYYDKKTDAYLVEVTYAGSRENAPY